MNPLATNRGFVVDDTDYAPFGLSWLRGTTPARFGLVELLCIIFALRQSTDALLSDPWREQLTNVILGVHIYVAASVPMLLLVNGADRRTAGSTNRQRIAALSLAVVAGAATYGLVVTAFYGINSWEFPGGYPTDIWSARLLRFVFPFASYFLRALLLGGLLTGVLYYVTREAAIAAAHRATWLIRIALDRQMAEAHLRVLQAQIEPHFLFNTLAHIKRLYRTDPDQGRTMLQNLSDYLRAALPQMRESESTLGRELALARAYLNVLQVRLGERLEVSIAVPETLYRAELPPMMLSTLVENAIKHGIAPLQQGGIVKIVAAREENRLLVSVADNGVGFQGFSGGGVGLANTRARLAALYGAEGLLTFAANPVRGVTVSISLPYGVRSREGAAA